MECRGREWGSLTYLRKITQGARHGSDASASDEESRVKAQSGTLGVGSVLLDGRLCELVERADEQLSEDRELGQTASSRVRAVHVWIECWGRA